MDLIKSRSFEKRPRVKEWRSQGSYFSTLARLMFDFRDSLIRSYLNEMTATKGKCGTYPGGRTRCSTNHAGLHTKSSPFIDNSRGLHSPSQVYPYPRERGLLNQELLLFQDRYSGESGRRMDERFRAARSLSLFIFVSHSRWHCSLCHPFYLEETEILG